MNRYRFISLLLLTGIALATACKKKKEPGRPAGSLPVISTGNITGVSMTSATGTGVLISQGTNAVTETGICWDTLPAPDLTKNHVAALVISSYSCQLENLKPATTYFVRAYATSKQGTAFGNDVSFRTPEAWLKQSFKSQPDIRVIKAQGSNIYLGTANGVLFSPDNGNTWQPAGLNGLVIGAMSAGPGVVFAAVNATIFKSTNNGGSWAQVLERSQSDPFTDLLVNGDDVYALTRGTVYLSQDNGQSWAVSGTGLPFVTCIKLALSETGGMFVITTTNGIYRADQKGGNWTQVATLSSNNVFDMVCAGSNIIVSQYISGPVVSINNGLSWIRTADIGNTNVSLSVLGSEVFMSTGTTCVLSQDKGVSWQPMNSFGLISSPVQDIVSSDGAFFVCYTAPASLYRLRR